MSFLKSIFTKEKKERLDKGLSISKKSFFSKLGTAIAGKSKVDELVLDELEEVLIRSDVGVATTIKIIQALENRVAKDKYLGTKELSQILRDEIASILKQQHQDEVDPFESELPNKPHVIMVVGVNGVGKTTTIGKIGKILKTNGNKVMFAASDTFRAAAIEQLENWANKINVQITKSSQGSDPASVAYKAIEESIKNNFDHVLIDTAGRLQNKTDLMEELEKIIRVIKKQDSTAPHNCIIVLDATSGQNVNSQVEIFSKTAGLTGIVMTKLDGTARGGVLVSVTNKFNLPIYRIGLGEKIDDLEIFDPKLFSKVIVGLDNNTI